jgi:hypothetical protein
MAEQTSLPVLGADDDQSDSIDGNADRYRVRAPATAEFLRRLGAV